MNDTASEGDWCECPASNRKHFRREGICPTPGRGLSRPMDEDGWTWATCHCGDPIKQATRGTGWTHADNRRECGQPLVAWPKKGTERGSRDV